MKRLYQKRKAGIQGKYSRREATYGFLFALPAIIFFGTFYLFPIIKTAQVSLYKWDILGTPTFVGLQNFEKLFDLDEFYNSLWVSLYYAFGTTVPIWFIALGLALLFNRRFKFRWGYLVTFYLPVVVPLIVWCILWQIMYHPTYGILTLITRPLGFVDVQWLTSSKLAMPSIIILSIWKGTPFYMVIYLAGLVSIPEEYVEAAQIDGANRFQTFLHIIIPLMKPIILYVVIISIINAFQIFDPFYVMTEGGPGSATRVVPLFIYQSAFHHLKMGIASAASLIFFAMILGLSLVILRAFRSS